MFGNWQRVEPERVIDDNDKKKSTHGNSSSRHIFLIKKSNLQTPKFVNVGDGI